MNAAAGRIRFEDKPPDLTSGTVANAAVAMMGEAGAWIANKYTCSAVEVILLRQQASFYDCNTPKSLYEASMRLVRAPAFKSMKWCLCYLMLLEKSCSFWGPIVLLGRKSGPISTIPSLYKIFAQATRTVEHFTACLDAIIPAISALWDLKWAKALCGPYLGGATAPLHFWLSWISPGYMLCAREPVDSYVCRVMLLSDTAMYSYSL